MAVSVPPEAAGSLPPQNLEAEASVLGAILISDKALDAVQVDTRLRPADFYRERHRLIYQAMLALKEKPVPEAVDVLTVCEELQSKGVLEEAGGTAYVHTLPGMVPSAPNAPHYARIVKAHALRRELIAAAHEIQDKAYGFSGDTRELLEQAEARLFRIGKEDRGSEIKSIADILHVEVDKLEQISREGVSMSGTPSGFKDIDDLTGGFQPGNLIVLAARPSMGKSALVTNMAENAAVDHGRPVALFSLEMSETELAQRFIASRAKLNGDDLRKGRVSAERWPKVIQATEKLAKAPLFVDDSSDIGIMELRAKARRLHNRHELGLVIVDYLQLMRPEDPGVGRVEQIGQISRGLKILARELEIPVIAVSQLSRAVEARRPPIPMLSDLRESGNIEQDADVVMFIYRDEYYNPDTTEKPGIAEIHVSKHRNGPIGVEELVFIARHPKFSSKVWDSASAATPPGA